VKCKNDWNVLFIEFIYNSGGKVVEMPDVCNVGFDGSNEHCEIAIHCQVAVAIFALWIVYEVKIQVAVYCLFSNFKVGSVWIFFSCENRNLVMF